ncbi:TIGR03862 family flavoprotein [Pseudophaeobacter leonis]|uniref:TIGR03862 family flavoprotein n=1 Tax=Pseudophaeobacter leonis TaxID=1144477 RepID=UPI0009F3733B|nr:TIGR03862 family flavoprotein [Pseudophaeobacter leonis]
MDQDQVWDAVVIGGGPAGLMAAAEIAAAGHRVLLVEAKPSLGRKFLMAGKSGLNLTKDEPLKQLLPHYGAAARALTPMVTGFGTEAIQAWARGLEQELFTGSTGRVFPQKMKASPLLRAWLAQLDSLGVTWRSRWRWTGWAGGGGHENALCFDTPEGPQKIKARITVLALGGASWARLGSDGAWADQLAAREVALAPFKPANVGLLIDWSAHMHPHFGQPVKGVKWQAGKIWARGEAVISARCLEGGGIYTVSAAVRDGAALSVDLLPDLGQTELVSRLARGRGKSSLTNHLRRVVKLGPARTALLQEFGRPLPQDPNELAALIKALPVKHAGLRPMDEAISTAGGVDWSALNADLMLTKIPGTFCAGEMLDWEAPTGGYLLTACFATGRWAGQGAVRYLAAD